MARFNTTIWLMVLAISQGAAAQLPATAVAVSQLAGGEIDSFLDVFGSGDQDAYERFIADRFDAASLATSSARDRADRLARLYVDSGGFAVLRRVRSDEQTEVVAAVGRLTQLPYCLTLTTRMEAGRRRITDFAAVDLPMPASATMGTPEPPEVSRSMSQFLDRLARADTFSGVILIARNGRPFLRRAYGRASHAYPAPVTLNTRFNIASIGKSITAVVIGQLLDEGSLALDDLVGRHLPDYPDAQVRDTVTIRQLLTHTSGLGSVSEATNSPLWPAARMRIRRLSDYVPLIIGHPLATEPGAQYAYSNSGFVILGLIVERLTGRPFYDAVTERVFQRAGMAHSFYHEADHEDPDVATPLTHFVPAGDDYRFRLGPRINATIQLAARGGSHGGAFVTADDLLRFITAVRTARLTSPATARLLISPQGAGRLEDLQNGFGFEIATQNGHPIVGHTGGDLGVSAFMYHFNPTDYTVIVLSNYDPRAIRVISRQVRGLLTRSPIGNAPPGAATDCTRVS